MDQFKKAMEKFLPHFVNHDLHLPQDYKFDFSLGMELLTWHFEWNHI